MSLPAKKIKIVIIGAGSTIYALEIIKDLCNNADLSDAEVCFVDINAKRLQTSLTLCQRYRDEVGAKHELSSTTDRRSALTGADFVISTALTVNYHKMVEGWDLAEKFGFKQTASLHVFYDEAFWINFYQLRLFEDIIQDMLDLCPEAWFFMVSNPVMAGITYLGRKYPAAKVLGICHGYREIFSICEELGLDPKKTSWSIPGANHFVWLNEFRYEGRDAFPILDQWIAEKSEDYWATQNNKVGWGTLSRKIIDLYRIHGVLAVGDTAHWIANAWPWWYSGTEAERIAWDEPTLRDKWLDFLKVLAKEQEERVALAADSTKKVSEIYPGKSDEHVLDMVDAIANNKPGDFIVNLLNTANSVPGVPLDFQVEVKARLSATGVEVHPTKPLPGSILAHLYRDRIAPVELELAAYEAGSYQLLVELVLMEHSATSKQLAEDFVTALLDLPWNREMKNHYKKSSPPIQRNLAAQPL